MTRKEWRCCTTFGRLLGLVLTVLAIGLDAGVSTAQGTGPGPAPGTLAGQDDTVALRQRAAEYWAARVAKDYRTQWELSEPRLKGRITADEYAAGRGAIQYLGYDVGDADIKGSFASVQVKVIARITLPESKSKPVVKTQTVPDAWIKVEGVWYRRADQESSPAMSGATRQ
jgi:hypothetical protein